MKDTYTPTTYDPATHDGATVAVNKGGDWFAIRPPHNLVTAGDEILVLEPAKTWPTEHLILIHHGYDSSQGEARNNVAYRANASGVYRDLFDEGGYSFYPDIAGDQIDEYTPLSHVPTDALVELLDSHDDPRDRISKFRLALLNTPGLNLTNK